MMNRKSITSHFIQVLFFAALGCDQSPKEYWNLFDLKGKVKTVTTEVSNEVINADSQPNWRDVYNFNESGQIIDLVNLKYDSVNRDFVLASETDYTYQENGLLKFESTYNSRGNLKTKFMITKYVENVLPSERKLVSGTSVTRITSNYTSSRKEDVSYYEDVPIDKRVKVYDANGNVTLEWLIYYDEKGDSSVAYGRSYKYTEFDMHGNWIKRIALPKGLEQSTRVERRTIAYF